MNVLDISNLIDGSILTDMSFTDREIHGMYTCDMLSFAMSNVVEDNAWVTIVNNRNIVAVASLTQAGCIIVTEDTPISEDIIQKAEEEQISIISTTLTSFEVCVRFGKKYDV